jgi:hypothetical protein
MTEGDQIAGREGLGLREGTSAKLAAGGGVTQLAWAGRSTGWEP